MPDLLNNLSKLSDAKLAKLVKLGNDGAFDVLTLRYLRNIGFLAQKYSVDGYDRNDFVQEGLMGLLYACRTFDITQKASFKSYVDIVVERRFISIVRKSKALKAVPSSSVVPLDESIDELEGECVNPEQLMLSKERFSLLLKDLKNVLSDREYTVLMLYCSGLSYVQIAKRLKITAKSADNALQRAKKKISLHYMSLKD